MARWPAFAGAALTAARAVVWLLSAPLPALAQERAVPFRPDAIPATIHVEVNGVAALETVRQLGRFHRVQGSPIALASREDGDVLAYEALNLADGRRSVSEIRDVLSGRYAPVPLSAIAEYFDLLVRARAVSYRP